MANPSPLGQIILAGMRKISGVWGQSPQLRELSSYSLFSLKQLQIDAVIGMPNSFRGQIVPGLYFIRIWSGTRFVVPYLPGRAATERTVSAILIVMILPIAQLSREILRTNVHCGIELFQIGALRSLDLTVQMRRRGLDGPKLDSIGHQFFLEAVGEELSPTICLDRLYWKRHFFD